MDIKELGWNEFFAGNFEKYSDTDLIPGRVAVRYKNIFDVLCEYGELQAEVSGSFHYRAAEKVDYPVVGDWVVLDPLPDEGRGTIKAVLPRKNTFSRKVAGRRTEEQVVAANIDYIFLVSSLTDEFNLRRIERYLTLIWESGSSPVIVLNKADLCASVEEKVMETEAIAFGVPVYVTSCADGRGIEELKSYLKRGQTVALLGSSGVGKSTLINHLLGENRQKTGEVRPGDDRGRHTTTRRELFVLPEGGMVVDTPGMREIQLWNVDEGVGETFEDIEELARNCRFSDCQHDSEPGCAVKEAIEKGIISAERLKNYRKLQREMLYLELKQMRKKTSVEKIKWKDLSKITRELKMKI